MLNINLLPPVYESGKRIVSIDIMKGIGIILVMIGHIIPNSSLGFKIIYGFHMPLFFFCSGFFFKDTSLLDSFKKDFKAIIIPWFTFVSVLLFCTLVLLLFSNGFHTVFNPLDENCFFLYYTIWFLICLFTTKQLYNILNKLHIPTIISCMFLSCIATVLNLLNLNIPFFIDSALGMLIFYYAGNIFREKEYHKLRLPIWLIISLFSFYIVIVWLLGPHCYVDIKHNDYCTLFIPLTMIPIIALYYLSCRLHSGFLQLCGIASISTM